MNYENASKLQQISFDFFYWFSRFEYGLKENKKFRSNFPNGNVKPDWDKFISEYKDRYKLSEQAQILLEDPPKVQKKDNDTNELYWEKTTFKREDKDLKKVVTCLKTTRNNLFHGGKHGDLKKDDVERNKKLLKNCKEILDQLAEMAGMDGDYTRIY